MEISEIKKTNGYTALVTYLIAVVCLILGLVLPLFDGELLAVQLPSALNSLAGRQILGFGKEFTQPFTVPLFGIEKAAVDFSALALLLYAVITVISLIGIIPVAISAKRGTSASSAVAYVIEVAAVISLSLYLICALQNYDISGESLKIKIAYSPLVALGGSLLMLIVLSIANKKGTGAAKSILFLMSGVALLTLFNIAAIIPGLTEPLKKLWESSKIYPLLFGSAEMGFSGTDGLNSLFGAKISDVLALLPDAKTKAALMLCAVVALLVLLNYFIDAVSLSTNAKRKGYAVCVVRYGLEVLALVALIITVAVCKFNFGLLLIVLSAVALIQLAISVARLVLSIKRADNVFDDEDEFVTYVKPVKQPKQLISPPPEEYAKPVKAIEAKPEPIEVEAAENKNAYVHKPEPEYNIRQDYNGQSIKPVQEIKPVAETAPVQESIPLEGIEVHEQPKAAEPEEKLTDDGGIQQTIPIPEEKPAQPVYTRPEPAQPVYTKEPVRPEPARTEPARTEYSQPAYPRTEAPQSAYTRQESVRPSYQQEPQTQPHIYTINAIYGGPTDDFIRKLTNDEKIEFAMTFIDRTKGSIGNIPEYRIGGNNKAFFSSVFIYLGRIRGLISESLLNKMYKELNML